MTTAPLLDTLSRLDYGARMRRMAEIGLQMAGDAALAAEVDGLAEHGVFGRALRLVAYAATRRSDVVIAALSDPSRRIRGLAVHLAPVACGDDDIRQALGTTGRRMRLALLRGLHRRRRYALIDRLLDEIAERGDDQLRRLLHLGTEAAFNRHFALVEERVDIVEWRRIAALHPAFAARELLRRAEAATERDRLLLTHANTVLPQLAQTAPEGALALVRSLLRHATSAELSLQQLVDPRPIELVELLLESADRAQFSIGGRAARLSEERLLEVLARQPALVADLQRHFERLSPATRAAVYAYASRGWQTPDGDVPFAVVALLPAREREIEGRRHLALPTLATRPERRLPYAALLPWDEALNVLTPYLGDPDADLRIVAWGALTYAVRYDRSRAGELLALVHGRRNEQDPVRGAMLSGLADAPPSTWQAQFLEALGSVLRDALDAADLSSGTGAAAERIVMQLVPFHPEWAAGWISTLARERGTISFSLRAGLSDADVRRIAPALLPVLGAWETRERERDLVRVAASFGRRLDVVPELVDMLERVLRTTPVAYVAASVLSLLARYQRTRLDTVIPELLQADRTWVTFPAVSAWLHRRRQDLLTPFLGRTAYRGRFGTGRTRFVLPLTNGFHRWLPEQQRLFALTLSEVARDVERDSPAAQRAIDVLAELPDAPPDTLIALAGGRRLALRDAALRALGRLDAGQGLPTLIESLDDDRARIAIYALRRAVLAMPEERALGVLRVAPFHASPSPKKSCGCSASYAARPATPYC